MSVNGPKPWLLFCPIKPLLSSTLFSLLWISAALSWESFVSPPDPPSRPSTLITARRLVRVSKIIGPHALCFCVQQDKQRRAGEGRGKGAWTGVIYPVPNASMWVSLWPSSKGHTLWVLETTPSLYPFKLRSTNNPHSTWPHGISPSLWLLPNAIPAPLETVPLTLSNNSFECIICLPIGPDPVDSIN